jgi:hypothetical protein
MPIFEDVYEFNPLNPELNPVCHLLALLGTHHILHFSGLRVNVQGNGKGANDGRILGRVQYEYNMYIRNLNVYTIYI